ncbi:(2Fe-2S)-binding protein [Amorphus sp. MBR-141]
MTTIRLTINGSAVRDDVEDRTLLVDFLRTQCRLTGTHVGCDTSQCGACTVHLDGRSVKACAILAAACDGCAVTTIEGIRTGDEAHPMQTAFHENHGLQCGFCTPGMIMAAIDMVARHGSDLDEATVRADLEGNLCRCTGYEGIVQSIVAGARKMG